MGVNEAIAEIEEEEIKKQQELDITTIKTKSSGEQKPVPQKKKEKIGDLIRPIAPALNEQKEQRDEAEEALKRILN